MLNDNQPSTENLDQVFDTTGQKLEELTEINNEKAEETLQEVQNNTAFMKKALLIAGVSFVVGLLGVAYVYRGSNNIVPSTQLPSLETNKTEIVYRLFGFEYASTVTTKVIERKI